MNVLRTHHKKFTPLPDTETIRLWIHRMSSAVVDVVLDEIVIRELR